MLTATPSFLVVFLLTVASPNHAQFWSSTYALPDEFPFAVSVKLNGGHLCTGALIDHRWALTAAHCLSDPNIHSVKELHVMAGSIDIHGIGGSLTAVEQLFFHKNFTRNPQQADVALLKLKKPFYFTSNIQPAVIGDAVAKMIVIELGWGMTSPLLEYIKLKVVESSPRCVLDQQHVCTYASDERCITGSAQLLVESRTKRLVGVSAGATLVCGFEDSDSFTRLYAFSKWISYIKTL